MDWQEEYKSKLVSPEEAVILVKSGDRVAVPVMGNPPTLCKALAERRNELRGVELFLDSPGVDYGWFQPGWEESFRANLDGYVTAPARAAVHERRADFTPALFSSQFKPDAEGWPDRTEIDVFMVVVSPPDTHGFCSFGSSLWNKRLYAKHAKTVLVEVRPGQIGTYGTNYIHVSEIDRFVESSPVSRPSIPQAEPEPYVKSIAGYISALIKDGDTIQIGIGTATMPLAQLGVFDGRQDLGWHSELTPPGIVKLIRQGVFTGKRKTLHAGKAVATAFGGFLDEEELAFVDMNPAFELYDAEYVVNIRTIAAHDNMVAINSTLAVDLTGQVASESLGPLMWGGSGGQPEFAMGAVLSKGGRSIIVVPSTASGGTVSRIVPMLEQGTIVTVPRTWVDCIVTEYGIARLLGKSQKKRAQELIAIAHPDFRPQLKQAADKLWWMD